MTSSILRNAIVIVEQDLNTEQVIYCDYDEYFIKWYVDKLMEKLQLQHPEWI